MGITKEEQKLINTIIQKKITQQDNADSVFSAKNKLLIQIDLIELVNTSCKILLLLSKNKINELYEFIENVGKNLKESTENGIHKNISSKIKSETSEQIVDGIIYTSEVLLETKDSFLSFLLKSSLFELTLNKLSNKEIRTIFELAAFFIAKTDGDISWLIDSQNNEKTNRYIQKIESSLNNFISFVNSYGLNSINLNGNDYIDFSINKIGFILSDSPMNIKTKFLLQKALLALVNDTSIKNVKAFFSWFNEEIMLLDRDEDEINTEEIKEALAEAKKIVYSIKNEAQEALVVAKPPVLSIAGPGAGKTATLIRKIEHEMNFVDLNKMLILTFTNKAAEELKERLRLKIKHQINTEYIGTFHSVFYKLIKRTVYNNWNLILPAEDEEILINIMCSKLNVSKKKLPAEAEMTFGAKIGDLKGSISKAIFNCLFDQESIVDFCTSEYGEKWGEIVDIYLTKKHKSAVMSFDDVLRYTLRLLTLNENWREFIKNSFSLIMVDEFQDTNKIQFAILSLISKKNNIIAVGDPYQSIYAFMNARIENVFDFHDEYEANVIQMILNYRSTKNIVALTNEITKHFSSKIDSDKITLKPTESASRVIGKKTMIYPTTSRELTTFELIKKDLINGVHPGEIAVITRLNRDSSKLEKLLSKAGIPFKKRGGLSFFERKECQIVLNALRFYLDRYSVSAFEVIAGFMENIGEETTLSISELAQMYIARIDSSLIYGNEAALKNKRRKEVLKMLTVFENYKEENFEDFLLILKDLNVISKLCDEVKTKAESEEIVENISELLDDVRLVFKNSDIKSALDEFVSMIMSKNSSRGDNKAITITTAHSSKGLEWEKVYIMDISANNFTECRQDMFEINDEQIRLLYVAVSRAKDELVLIYQSHTLNGVKKNMDKVLTKIWAQHNINMFSVPDNLLIHMPKY